MTSPEVQSRENLALDLFSKLNTSVDLVLDIGAAVGDWSKLANTIWPNSKIIAVEPQEYFVEILKKLTFIENIYNCLVHSSCEELEFHISKDKFSSSVLYPGETTTLVMSHKLECILDESGKESSNIFVKTDLQGCDLIALESAGPYLEKIVGVQMECQTAEYVSGMTGLGERITLMRNLGFEVFDLFNPLYRPSDGALGQIDVLFVRATDPSFNRATW